ncbi:hypothetical protein ACVIHI_002374 [Bradyrhizobium sp. USDA 4524]|uniref:Pentapeptide MXKDX repeat protein n=1 Tax=Bradyrhizobium brasilense TaxID=1419277 RepID=A0A1G6X1W2_9BRAD|nr:MULTISPECIES: hypothetical protein [Bradyrhizobium]KRP96045.1 hypothetical protein AOQ73_23015 [Bradyrhizobium pachyrhizi]MCA1397724.1 hypothetical protein [Bradyrhizobium sp. BRP56]MCC8971683.1 hypothetical protein [Bradyrhizobium brasilense]MCP1844703.1 hypothetical protein [Bradyrhizobium sp. USDA 4538]MCP1905268.1 hypothetical protein [Bradyrhizobium sp. USDA 4537]
MCKLIAVTVFTLICGAAFAQDIGPAPQSGMERPENTNGATQSGAMDTTGMDVKRANKSEMKNTAKGAAKRDDAKK